MKRLTLIAILLISTLVSVSFRASASSTPGEAEEAEKKIDPKEIIFEHLSDRYGWEVPFCHHKSISLPIIVFGSDGLHIFSSSRIDHGQEWTDGNATFKLSEGDFKGKVVEIIDGKEVRPFDISITKNVCALFITIIVMFLLLFPLKRYYRRNGYKAPRGWLGSIEALTEFIYNGVIKGTLKDKSRKFAPYLLTVFYFIFVMNLMGLMVVFPGGANLTGNIAVTLVLAVCTFLVTNIFGTKHYWKDIFWPDVPLWLKFPLPIMPIIEVFGIFTKPAALTVRLFANMMGGHMIVIVLTLLIFIFASFGMAVAGGTAVVSTLFSIFMILIDVLVSFIQAYVFTMLSTIFISLAQENPHAEHKEEHGKEEDPVYEAGAAEAEIAALK
ncbi:MAG: F0F1 ATP synthase subunit A [Bacteroidales bacterium]|nr:F0F1 ATP synthase subunit A [Bacteroidales bacterium]